MQSKQRKPTRSPWMTSEVAILRKHYPTNMPIEEIAKMLPNHPASSFKAYAQKVLKLRRPTNGRFFENRGWNRIVELLAERPMTAGELAAKTGKTKQSTGECLRLHRSEWHIAGEIPRRGVYTRLIALGADKDVVTKRKGRNRPERAITAVNPFLVAAGSVKPRETITGRVIKQDMTIHLDHLDEMEAA
ncbi:transcriptional regulator [Burkholderia sp. GbtcB21]|uniref:transcriptional regulator n=1 Tax=Burkholderia sp. GbtcB21 TaxID=2824766 RepID=UPI001C2F4CD5|nr:transcriptional regulator [Burkholderia sp. GbtcB21]